MVADSLPFDQSAVCYVPHLGVAGIGFQVVPPHSVNALRCTLWKVAVALLMFLLSKVDCVLQNPVVGLRVLLPRYVVLQFVALQKQHQSQTVSLVALVHVRVCAFLICFDWVIGLDYGPMCPMNVFQVKCVH